ncbi:MAG: tyrosine-type recombinase/integrase [Ferruginibacter sp.]
MKKGYGYLSVRIEWIFLEFDNFFLSKNVKTVGITKEQIEEWRLSRINDAPNTLYAKYSLFSQFCKFMCQNGHDCYIPRLYPSPANIGFTPTIFTHKQISEIFQACDQLELFDRHMSSPLFMIPAIIRTLYATGLRISEALSLKNKDIDLDKCCLYVRKSKNGNERMVPMSETLVTIVREYLNYRNRIPLSGLNDSDRPFFITLNGSSCHSSLIYRWFKKGLAICLIPHQGNHKGPRLHDLRHTFAVHSLAEMAKAGLDLYYSLPLLATCLGHKALTSTEQYIRLTAEIYPDLLKDEQKIYAYVFPKLTKITNDGNN